MTTDRERRISGFDDGAKPLDSVRFPHEPLGQSYPQHYPHRLTDDDALGEPLSIREVARVIGCSAWTVRHAHLPQGLPHFRSGPSGKLVFFRKQVIAWILQQQKKGSGSPRTGLRPWGEKGGI